MPAAAMEQMQDVTPEQAKAGMEQWMVWQINAATRWWTWDRRWAARSE